MAEAAGDTSTPELSWATNKSVLYLNKTLKDKIFQCVSVLFEHFEHIQQYRDNIYNRDNFGHNNRDMKFSYRYISSHK